jgi:bifunctional non-homologous end joining protein LigD
MSNVMLAKQGSIKDLGNKEFIFEPKFDGTRVLIYKSGGKIKLINRRDRDITRRYPELKDLWKNIKSDSIIDGELVTLGKNHQPDFNLLQKREQLEDETKINILSHETPATIFVFDILKLKSKNLIGLPLLERKKFLSQQIKSSSKIALTPYTRNGKGLWKKVQRIKLEGVMAKKADGKYHKTRDSAWLKIKNTKSIEAIIIGYTREKRRISALALGAYHKGKLIYIGKVAAGLDEKTISHLSKELIPAKEHVSADSIKGINFVKPKVVVEVKYLEVTRDLKLRAPSLLRIRTDKKVKECTI